MVKFKRKEMPAGLKPEDFKYHGAAAKEQDGFDGSIGIADMACVDQFGKSNKAKYYHMGVVSANGRWFAYFEWGRVFAGKSWEGGFHGQDFQFIEESSQDDANYTFQKKCREKNTKRIEKKKIGGSDIWVGRNNKDGYIVQSLATRDRGLPDAYSIKDSSGLKEGKKKVSSKKTTKRASNVSYQPQVLSLASDLVGGTKDYTRALSAASGVIPTLESIMEVEDVYLPAALQRLSKVGDDLKKQVKDKDLVSISNLVASLVPRPISRGGSLIQRQEATILSSANILSIQQDLDAFKSSLENEDFSIDSKSSSTVDPKSLLGADITWIDPKTTKGKWIESTFRGMSNNRHGYMRGKLKINNIFEVRRQSLDNEFVKSVQKVANKNSRRPIERARLQPSKRIDLLDISDYAEEANVFLSIHGTRAVNVHPIISSNLRLPKHLKGVHISGANFGHGLYFATDWRKSYGYVGHGRAVYGSGGGIKNRGFFMFLCDTIMGNAYMTKRTGSWGAAPAGCDSVAAYPEHTSVANDEHVIFDPNYQRIRYIIEADLV